MNILIVTAFYDIGRAGWQISPRSREQYIGYANEYLKKLPLKKYILTDEDDIGARGFDYADITSPSQLKAYGLLPKSKKVMSESFFVEMVTSAKQDRIEYHHAEYNIVGLAKWDALERAHKKTAGNFSHYMWLDYGIGRRGSEAPFLPIPRQIKPEERTKIVLSAKKTDRLHDISAETLRSRVSNGRFYCAGGLQIVPGHLVEKYGNLARSTYNDILDTGLCVNDQVLLDVMHFISPDIFHLSTPPKYFDVFENIDRILTGQDGILDFAKMPLLKKWAALKAKERFLKKL
ncbi:WlaTC/HtrL family glycosyltransferase [Agrobacterium vaccinii]|uniref:WlaTC/HtrL family glycosyltransferase n=1 Tax=Agrobacterium vaccinii TaxID=2735528 RepID=UPI001E2C3C6B|nr:WlaTC/HtrL family glycosyltransferase [Agrobacterium vaccinii]UHS57108.1 hypothetical protein HRS00_09985 [Agrobacterium vaccinii]